MTFAPFGSIGEFVHDYVDHFSQNQFYIVALDRFDVFRLLHGCALGNRAYDGHISNIQFLLGTVTSIIWVRVMGNFITWLNLTISFIIVKDRKSVV